MTPRCRHSLYSRTGKAERGSYMLFTRNTAQMVSSACGDTEGGSKLDAATQHIAAILAADLVGTHDCHPAPFHRSGDEQVPFPLQHSTPEVTCDTLSPSAQDCCVPIPARLHLLYSYTQATITQLNSNTPHTTTTKRVLALRTYHICRITHGQCVDSRGRMRHQIREC